MARKYSIMYWTFIIIIAIGVALLPLYLWLGGCEHWGLACCVPTIIIAFPVLTWGMSR